MQLSAVPHSSFDGKYSDYISSRSILNQMFHSPVNNYVTLAGGCTACTGNTITPANNTNTACCPNNNLVCNSDGTNPATTTTTTALPTSTSTTVTTQTTGTSTTTVVASTTTTTTSPTSTVLPVSQWSVASFIFL